MTTLRQECASHSFSSGQCCRPLDVNNNDYGRRSATHALTALSTSCNNSMDEDSCRLQHRRHTGGGASVRRRQTSRTSHRRLRGRNELRDLGNVTSPPSLARSAEFSSLQKRFRFMGQITLHRHGDTSPRNRRHPPPPPPISLQVETSR